jgi:hypothetical protein
MPEKDALDKLIVSESEVGNLDLLASLVKSYLQFIKETGEIIPNKEFYKLKDWKKLLIYLLGRKVIFIKKLNKDFIEEVTPKEIEDIFGVKSKSITKYAAVELKGIIKSDKGKYKIPNYNLFKCEEILKKNE